MYFLPLLLRRANFEGLYLCIRSESVCRYWRVSSKMTIMLVRQTVWQIFIEEMFRSELPELVFKVSKFSRGRDF